MVLAYAPISRAQPAIQISGEIRIHSQGKMGFHTDLVNDSPFEDNLGLAGFYGEELLNVSGHGRLAFFDIELLNPEGLLLEKVLSINNNCNFILGDFHTPRLDPEVYVLFGKDAFYQGSSDSSKIDGAAAVLDCQSFLFPVGDPEHIRALMYSADQATSMVKCSYYYEAPTQTPGIIRGPGWNILSPDLAGLSQLEYWLLEAEEPAKVQISWGQENNLSDPTTAIDQLVIAGWSKAKEQWISLGQEDLEAVAGVKKVSSNTFWPNDFERITLGYLVDTPELRRLGNYLLTPNGDGTNDQFVLPEDFQNTQNDLRIYDRNGIMVFRMTNYSDQFSGFANTKNSLLHHAIGLPEGIYFYLLSTKYPTSLHQGFIYLDR